MQPGFLMRLRPAGPWRFGPDSGDRERLDFIYHSDSVYSAVTGAMAGFGWLDEWLAATAENAAGAAVRFSSCYPFSGDTLLVTPPRNIWPPSASAKLRYSSVEFAPLEFIEALLSDEAIREDEWTVDPESRCLLPSGRNRVEGPFRAIVRSSAAVDRMEPGKSSVHSLAGLQFRAQAGLWLTVAFADEEARERWGDRVKSAFRFLADDGFGGARSRGWGRAHAPEFTDGELPGLLFSRETAQSDGAETAYWLLSLFVPAENDSVDWKRGSYAVMVRSGRAASLARAGDLKRPLPMISEGSVLFAGAAPLGSARNVAPEGFPHPVYRAGFPVAIPVAWRTSA